MVLKSKSWQFVLQCLTVVFGVRVSFSRLRIPLRLSNLSALLTRDFLSASRESPVTFFLTSLKLSAVLSVGDCFRQSGGCAFLFLRHNSFRGVVQLFNAVAERQKKLEGTFWESRTSKKRRIRGLSPESFNRKLSKTVPIKVGTYDASSEPKVLSVFILKGARETRLWQEWWSFTSSSYSLVGLLMVPCPIILEEAMVWVPSMLSLTEAICRKSKAQFFQTMGFELTILGPD